MSEEEPPYETEDECIVDFFNNNLKQLQHYKSSFIKRFQHKSCEKAHVLNCQENIEKEYLPLAEESINEYDCLKESLKVKNFMISLNRLKNTKPNFFKTELEILINSLLE